MSLSTLADQVGACVPFLPPISERLQAHVFAAERLHGDDTTVPVLAKGKTDTGALWTYVRDDRPFGGKAIRQRRCSIIHATDAGEHPKRIWRLCRHTAGRCLWRISKLYDA